MIVMDAYLIDIQIKIDRSPIARTQSHSILFDVQSSYKSFIFVEDHTVNSCLYGFWFDNVDVRQLCSPARTVSPERISLLFGSGSV